MNRKEIVSNIIWFVGLLAIILLLRHFVITPVAVSGDSMVPTLVDKERVIQLKVGEVKRFDIVTFPAPDQPGENYIKRVIGLPGDTIAFKGDILYINDQKVEEPYLTDVKEDYSAENPYTSYKRPVDETSYELMQDFTLKDIVGIETQAVPEGKVFVLGDNRPISKDSRYIGLIDLEAITGDVKFVFWPPSRIGTVATEK